MSDDKKQRAPEIAVRSMRFVAPIDIPGRSVTQSCDAEPLNPEQPGKQRYEITFIPHLRHHRIVFHRPNTPPEEAYVHEQRVESWKPA